MKGLYYPNIVQLFDDHADKNVIYFVMQYVYGPTLDDLIFHHAARPLPLVLAIDIIRQVAYGLDHIQSINKDFVHRDIKPSNLLLERTTHEHLSTPHRWRVLIADFGLAVIGTDMSITKSQEIVGSVPYMAPEQLEPHRTGTEITSKADLFSLGVIAYQLVTGFHPFQGESYEQRLKRISSGIDAVDPKQWNPSLPDPLRNLVWRMLNQNSEFRPEPREVVSRLTEVFDQLQTNSLTQSLTICDPCEIGTAQKRESRFRPSRRLRWILAATAISLVCALTLLLPFNIFNPPSIRNNDETPTPGSAPGGKEFKRVRKKSKKSP